MLPRRKLITMTWISTVKKADPPLTRCWGLREGVLVRKRVHEENEEKEGLEQMESRAS